MKTYSEYKHQLGEQTFPFACLDMELFEQNIEINRKRSGNKKIRIASKSVRCPELMRHILNSNEQYQGIMCYHGEETLYLAKNGFDDLLMGYPIVDKQLIKSIAQVIKEGKYICLMVDHPEHLNILQTVGKTLDVQIPICLDIDLSDRYPGLNFGVWRSSINNETDLTKMLDLLKSKSHLRLDGLMGYEAQVAGVGDQLKSKFKSQVIRGLKKRSIKKILKRRKAAVNLIQKYGFQLQFVNGGGTGSLESTSLEEVLTEVTVGSGFFCSHLFDYYQQFELHPALFYAVQIVRIPTAGTYTCHGGGFIASGGVENTKAPIVHLPKGGRLDSLEGAGEVQTPVRFKALKSTLELGDPIFFRHAKAGELCERFNSLILIEANGLRKALTYRGLNCSFG